MIERPKPASSPRPAGAKDQTRLPKGIEVVEGDPETVWGMWDQASAAQQNAVREASADRRNALRQRVLVEAVAPPKPVRKALHTVLSGPLPPAFAVPAMDQHEFEPTRPMDEKDKSLNQRAYEALDTIEMHHARIGKTLRTMWGYPECSEYIAKLLMSGTDDTGNARVGFHHDAVTAMLGLGDLHDAIFGFARESTDMLSMSPSQFSKLGRR